LEILRTKFRAFIYLENFTTISDPVGLAQDIEALQTTEMVDVISDLKSGTTLGQNRALLLQSNMISRG